MTFVLAFYDYVAKNECLNHIKLIFHNFTGIFFTRNVTENVQSIIGKYVVGPRLKTQRLNRLNKTP